MPAPVRCALIGYGLFGAHHARAIEKAAHAELAGIAVPSEASRARAAAEHPGIELSGDYRRLLDRTDVDLVDIVVPNLLHFEVARDALAAGKHVLLEKPMALELDQCDELIELARRQEKLLAVNHELRLSSLWGRARELLDEGAVGEVQHVLIELSRFPYRSGSQGWRWDPKRVGSWILEEPIHFFDLARWYLARRGDPTAITARANSRHAEQPRLYDNFTALVDFPEGAYAVVSQTLVAFGHHQTAKICGTNGTIWAWWSAADARSEQPSYGLRYGLGDDVREVTLRAPAGELLELDAQLEAVCRAVQEGTSPPCRGEDGRWSTRLCLAAEASIEQDGQRQSF